MLSSKYKLIPSKLFYIFLLLSLLSACGGSGSEQTAKEIAIEKITSYAQDASNPSPTLQDYIDAGVTGLTADELDELNTVVSGLSAADVDTTAELDALTSQLNINIAPTAEAGEDKTTQVNQGIQITGNATDADGTIASIEWTKGSSPLASTASFTYTPTTVGNDTLTITVTDNDGSSASDTMTVTVLAEPVNQPPTADAGENLTVQVNNTINIAGTASDDGSISTFEWKIGDTVLSTNASFDYTPTTVGTDQLIFTVTDNLGATGLDTMEVTVTAEPLPPTSKAGQDKKGIINQAITITGAGSDPDGTISSFLWTKDGVEIADTASFEYTPTTKGTDTLTLEVTDSQNLKATDTMNVFVGIEIPDSNRFLTFVTTGEVDANELNAVNELKADAYYTTIDPYGRKNTLEKWYIENCFKAAPADYSTPPNCAGDIGNHAFAIYLNNVDLNLGRRMALRSNANQVIGSIYNFLGNTVASCVENYSSIEDAVTQANMIATVCMEYSPDPLNPSGKKFTKFFTYGPAGERINKVDLDGRGEKYQPDMCLTCHGGTPGTITTTGKYSDAGDTKSGFIPWDLNNFMFHSSDPLLDKDTQENEFRKLNQAALRTYQVFDSGGNEQAKATRELIRGWYNFSGNTIPDNSTFNGSYTPTGWQGRESLYHDVVVPSCRACHIQRGLSNDGSIDFSTAEKFLGYTATIKDLVYKKGTMPLAKRTYDLFWDNLREGNQAEKLWNELVFSGDIEIPGAPVPKIAPLFVPDDIYTLREVALDGRGSLFSESFKWEVINSPDTGLFSLTNDTSPVATLNLFNDAAFGAYRLKLTTTNANGVQQFVESNISIQLSFSGSVLPILESKCSDCHFNGGSAFGNFPMEGANTYNEVKNRVAISAPFTASLLLTKATDDPVGHGGGDIFTNISNEYKTILKWIEQGALDN